MSKVDREFICCVALFSSFPIIHLAKTPSIKNFNFHEKLLKQETKNKPPIAAQNAYVQEAKPRPIP